MTKRLMEPVAEDARRLLVLGMGNEILSDDGVGLVALDLLKERRFGEGSGGLEIAFRKLNTGGLDLIYETEGFDALIVVDAYFAADGIPGRVRVIPGDKLADDGPTAVDSAHLLSLGKALSLSCRLGYRAPELIAAVVVDVGEGCLVFGEELSPDVARAAAQAADLVEMLVEEYARAAAEDEAPRHPAGQRN